MKLSMLSTPNLFIACLVLMLATGTTAFACGHPVEMRPWAEVLSRQNDEHLGYSPVSDNWQLPQGFCLVRNYTDCNSQELFANVPAGSLLFGAETEFCSPEEKKHLRALFVEVNLFGTFFFVVVGLILTLLWRKASSLDLNGNGGTEK